MFLSNKTKTNDYVCFSVGYPLGVPTTNFWMENTFPPISNKNMIIPYACFNIEEHNMVATSKVWAENSIYCYILARPSINSNNHLIFAWNDFIISK
jgi:hypothetical protein